MGKKFSAQEIKDSMLLYAVTDRQWLKEGERLVDKVREAIEGGATFVQLREKDMDPDAMEAEALELKALCEEYGVPFVINDNVMLAKKIDCDGVHVGQEDMTASEVRKIIGPDKILGVSAKTVEQSLLAQEMGADYLGLGAVFTTGTKPMAESCHPDTIKEITAVIDIPSVAIGGINGDNVSTLSGHGLDGVAVVSAIFAQDDAKAATAQLLEKTKEALL